MPIRVIAGSAKGRRLKLVPGDTTRPIMDRVKEALFSIIGRSVIEATFLDLFAGTGSVGIEALSRGAEHATFVDMEGKAIQVIQNNLQTTGLSEKAVIRRADVLSLLKQSPSKVYDIIYIAPPQYKELWLKTLQAVDQNPRWYSSESTIIVQIDPREYQQIDLQHLMEYDQRQYGQTMLVFYKTREETEE
jgi:16S rRNA (guanine966-N2)-methyltransferase